ncbi:MAG: heme NO-binding domain-containing protein, partial [Gammaproteobacteria bacterium]
MKGVIFNLLEEIVEDEFGADTWDALLEAAEASGVYTSIGSYDDGEMMGLVAAASAQLNLTQDEVLRWFG